MRVATRMMLAATVAAALASGCSKPPEPLTTLYVAAPSLRGAGGASLLPAEAVLRAVAIEAAARGVDVIYLPADQAGLQARAAYPQLTMSRAMPDEGAGWTARLARSPEYRTDLVDGRFDTRTWRALIESVTSVKDAVVEQLEPAMPRPAASTMLTGARRSALAGAFERLCEEGPEAALPVAAIVDEALAAHPADPEARLAAAWPSCMLASMDVRGRFMLRQRFLAAPVSWFACARDGLDTEDARGMLTEAWLAFLCGFPNESLAMLEGLGGEAAGEPLGRALRTYCRRNWTTLSGGRAQEASAIEQLAWVWALQECGIVEDRLEDVSAVMRRRECGAFGPVYGVEGAAAGREFTGIMMADSSFAAIREILGLKGLDEDGRRRLTAQFNEAVSPAAGVSAALVPVDPDELWPGVRLSDGMRLLTEAYALAADARDGPLRAIPGGGVAWQCLSPWTYAHAARGHALTTVMLRMQYLMDVIRDPVQAQPLIRAACEGVDPTSDAAGILCALRMEAEHKIEASGGAIQGLVITELGLQPSTWSMVAGLAEKRWLDYTRRWMGAWPSVCGAFEAEMALATLPPEPTARSRAWLASVAASDRFNRLCVLSPAFGYPGDGAARGTARSMPYHFAVIRSLGDQARRQGSGEVAVELCRAMVNVCPDLIGAYRALSDALSAAGRGDEAIGTLVEGCTRCSYGVASAESMSRLATLLYARGEKAEALTWAAAGAKAGGEGPMLTHARLLAREGRAAEATEVYRLGAHRYDGIAYEYLMRALEAESGDEVVGEATELAQQPGSSWQAYNIVVPLAAHGRFDAALDLLEGSFRAVDGVVLLPTRGLYHLFRGEYAESWEMYAEYIEFGFYRRKQISSFDAHVLYRAYVAALLSRDEAAVTHVAAVARIGEGWPQPCGKIVDYIARRTDRDETLKRVGSSAELYWVLAAEAEAAGDEAEAARWYSQIARYEPARSSLPGCFARLRLDAMGRPEALLAESTEAR